MRTTKLLALSLIAVAVLPSGARAQACLGLPSFNSGSVHVNALGEFPEGVTAYALGIGAGRPNNLFGNLGGGQVSFDGFDEKSTYGFLEFGYQLPFSIAQFCPIAGGSFGVGPDDPAAGIKLTTYTATGGAAVGVTLGNRTFAVAPNAAVLYHYLTEKIDEEGAGSFKETYNSATLNLGLALILFDRVSLQPLARIPIHGDETEVTYGAFLSVSLGFMER